MRFDARNEKQRQNRVLYQIQQIVVKTHTALQFKYILWAGNIGCTRGQIRISKAIIEYINKFNTMQLNECLWMYYSGNSLYMKNWLYFYWICHSMRRIAEKRFVHLLCAKQSNTNTWTFIQKVYEIHIELYLHIIGHSFVIVENKRHHRNMKSHNIVVTAVVARHIRKIW